MKRLMIVDDEELAIEYICSLIDWEQEGYQIVAEMHSVIQAECMLESMPIDIVIFDVLMADHSGVDLSVYIRDHHPEVGMLAISGFDNYDYVRDILKNGAYDYILKHRLSRDVLLKALSGMTSGVKEKNVSVLPQKNKLETDRQTVLLDALENKDLELLKKVVFELLQDDEDWRASAQGMFQLILVFFHRNNVSVSPKITADLLAKVVSGSKTEVSKAFLDMAYDNFQAKHKFSHYVQDAIDFINNNYQLDIGLNDCANVIGVNASYLSRVFHQEAGELFTKYLNAIRLEKSKELIDAGNPLKQVAYECGFRDYSYFFKVFKKENEITPQQYAERESKKST